MSEDESGFFAVVWVPKVEGRIFQVQHEGGESPRWAMVEKPELAQLVEDARLWQAHAKDILEFHQLSGRDGRIAKMKEAL